MNGFILIYRKMLEWEWYDDIPTKTLFLHLLLKANYEDKKWHGEIVRRGSLITSYSQLEAETHLSGQQIRTSLKKLESTNEITRRATNKYTLIIVKNYDYYQGNQQATNKQSTNNQQATNKQSTTTKQYNNITKKQRNKKTYEAVEGYTENEALKNEIAEFIKMRETIKKPMTDRAVTMLLNRLDSLGNSDDEKIRMLQQSIEHDWQTVYRLKEPIFEDSTPNTDGNSEEFYQLLTELQKGEI